MNASGRSWEELKQIRSCGIFFFPDAVYVVASARTVLLQQTVVEQIEKVALHITVSLDGEKVSVVPTERDASH